MYINTVAGAHPVQQSEMLRKAMNNITTTSDTYLAVFTIGYFEIRQPITGTRYMPILGREVYNEIPGDLRVQYAAVIDRSMLAVSPEPPAAGTLPRQASNVFFTELTAPFNPADNATQAVTLQFRATGGTNGANIIVNYEGNAIKIRPRPAAGNLAADEVSTIVVGTGSEAVAIRIPTNATIIAPTGGNGLGIISFPPNSLVSGLAANPATSIFVPNPVNTAAPPPTLNQYRQYYAGEALGSAILANPGPQAGFDPNSAAYRQVVRDLLKLTP
jgi:hypothetical protein